LGIVLGRMSFSTPRNRVCRYSQFALAMLNFNRGLGTELQRRGIARHTQWGAYGIVVSPVMLAASALIASQNHLSRTISAASPFELRKPIFSADVGGILLPST
jgi:hypothetical protein